MLLPESSVAAFFKFINSVEASINFTMECENEERCISFLDISITRNLDCTFSTNLYSKPTDTGRHLSFFSHHPVSHKRSVVLSLIKRAKSIPWKHADCVAQIRHITDILCKNGFS